MILKHLFISHKYSILLTYFLTILGILFNLLYPFIIGVTINELLQKRYESLILLICIWLAYDITEVARKIYDTRTFTNVYSHLVTLVVLEQNKQGVPNSQIIARSALTREFVDFFERDIPQILRSLFDFFGALVMLFIYDIQMGFYSLALLIPIIFINYVYVGKSIKLNQKLNDHLEDEVEILTACKGETVYQHYLFISKLRIYLSNAEAANYGFMELLSLVFAVAILLRATQLPGVKAGDLYAIISYLWNYWQSLSNVPILVQQFSRLKDIGDRVKLQTSEIYIDKNVL
ncbi:ABC transporter six-transmembrane domain-containing protein [Nostoc sp.]|uniref:ABC transporter six-transmembrane domain-containing protein n=1 Tax=Nostoc sp. TaxID=1180 RepID=UPI002FFB210F